MGGIISLKLKIRRFEDCNFSKVSFDFGKVTIGILGTLSLKMQLVL